AAQGSVAVHSAVRHGQLHVVFGEDAAAQGTEVARRRVVEDAAVGDRQKAVEVAEDAAARAEGPTGRVLRDLAVLHDQAAGEVGKNAAADATGEKAGAVATGHDQAVEARRHAAVDLEHAALVLRVDRGQTALAVANGEILVDQEFAAVGEVQFVRLGWCR